jgi:glycosyltransferase involved in cell wall biosynthesis
VKTIFIDGLGLVDGHFSGVGQYIYGILKGMDEYVDQAKYAGQLAPNIVVIVPYDSVARFKGFGFKHIGFKKIPLSFRVMSSLWHRGKLPPIDLICGRGIYIFPRFVGMPLLFSKSILVIYDLSFELHRQYSDEGNARFLSAAVKRSLPRSSRVITISQNAQKELLEFYALPKDKVSVATPATDPRIMYRRSPKEIESVKDKYEIKGDYILALSNLEPRKNLDMLVDVYCSLPARYRKNTSLLLVGVSGWKTDELFQKIVSKVQLGYNIIRPSRYVLDEDKPAIISGAKMLVYPSHYEGFGMPPLEALACGIPVITSDNSSLPEVVGDSAVMIDSHDQDALRKAIINQLESADPQKLIDSGPAQAEHFSWQSSAQVFLDAVKELDT